MRDDGWGLMLDFGSDADGGFGRMMILRCTSGGFGVLSHENERFLLGCESIYTIDAD